MTGESKPQQPVSDDNTIGILPLKVRHLGNAVHHLWLHLSINYVNAESTSPQPAVILICWLRTKVLHRYWHNSLWFPVAQLALGAAGGCICMRRHYRIGLSLFTQHEIYWNMDCIKLWYRHACFLKRCPGDAATRAYDMSKLCPMTIDDNIFWPVLKF